jgi:Ca2+-binding EF-hand superfamily protein
MFFNQLLPYEIPIMENFIKYKTRQIVSIIFKEFHGYIPRVEAPYLIRYFLQFPSQSQVVDEILPEIEKLESTTEKSKDIIEIQAFEKHLIDILKLNKYSSYDKETLIEAFRVLDVEKKGYLDLHTFYSFIKNYGITFTKTQIEEMEKFLLENANEVFESLGTRNDEPIKHKQGITSRKFFYESYVRKVLSDDEKHFDSIMKEYKEYYDEYTETKVFREMPELGTQPQEQQEIKEEEGEGEEGEENKEENPEEGKENKEEEGEENKDKEEGDNKEDEIEKSISKSKSKEEEE